MKKGGLFGKIIYYVFTFLIGIVIALGLPYYFLTFTVRAELIEESLKKGDYATAVMAVGNYFYKTPAYQCDIEGGGGIVLFEAVVQSAVSNDGDSDTDLFEGRFYKTYFGFVYGVGKSYDTYGTELYNKTALIVTNSQGEHTIELLDFDADGNETKDGIATQNQNGFIIIDLSEEQLAGGIDSLKLVDRKGNTFWQSPETNLNLNFQTDFFHFFDGFLDEYNALLADYNNAVTESELQVYNTQLTKLFNEFNAELVKNDDYAVADPVDNDYVSVNKKLQKAANTKAIWIVVAYFVVIYIIGDFILGSHYIIKFFRWFIYDVCKAKPKNKQKLKKSEIFGHDYYSSVTMSLDLEDLPDFNESVQVKYTNTDVEIVFILLKENNYTATERIKAGTYVNPFIDMNREYAPVDLPENLEVEGYKMDVKIKIIRREV